MANRVTTQKKTPTPTPIPTLGEARQLVRRKCQVCEWEAELLEQPGAQPDCPWCHGPTERVAVSEPIVNTTNDGEKNPHAAALGRLGGLKGGRARAAILTPKRRREIALKAAKARWGKGKS
jgi:hypothetical protein